MRKIITFLFLASTLCLYAQNENSIYYIMDSEEPIIKKHIDRLEDKEPNENNKYIYITQSPSSQSIYLLSHKTNFFGDKSNRRLLIGDNSFPIIFDLDYLYATFTLIDSIGNYNKRDGTYLKKTFIVENSPIIYTQSLFTGIADIITSGDNGLYSIESRFPEIKELDSLKYSTTSDTIFIKIAHHDNQAISIQAWSKCDHIHIYPKENAHFIDQFDLSPLEQELFDNWNKMTMPSIFEKYSQSALAKYHTTYYQIIIRNNSAILSHFKFL